MDKTALRRAAVFYLQRYPSSSENLKRVLLGKVRRKRKPTDEDRELVALVEQEMRESGLIDDAAYAKGIVQSAMSSGRSSSWAERKLRQNGVCAMHIETALEVIAPEEELAAAERFAQRRRIGPYRLKASGEEPRAQRQKDLAKMNRRGFTYAVASQVIDGDG